MSGGSIGGSELHSRGAARKNLYSHVQPSTAAAPGSSTETTQREIHPVSHGVTS